MVASYKLVFIVPFFTEHNPCYSEEESNPLRPTLRLPTTHHPVPQQAEHFKSTKGSTDDLNESLASDNTYDALSHKQRSEAISKQMQEEITADLQAAIKEGDGQSCSGPSVDTGQDNGHKNDNTVDLEQLMFFLKDLPINKLKFFASKLLRNDVITDIRHNGELTIESICKAFVKEDPEASWMKVSLALEQAECNELAKDIRTCFC